MAQLSIIVPVLNEAEALDHLLLKICEQGEVIVVDGGSRDQSLAVARNFPVKVLQSPAGRALQMNRGASLASGETLFFLHADSHLPENFSQAILQARQQGYQAGCFRLKFDWPHWFLRSNAWFTRFNLSAVRFGDQGLFVSRELFKKVEGYREEMSLLEDQDIVIRLKRFSPFRVLPQAITTSARKYRQYGPFYLQWVYFQTWRRWKKGLEPEELLKYYRKKLEK